MHYKNESIISEIKFQAIRLENLIFNMESTETWQDNLDFYIHTLGNIEKSLKKVRVKTADNVDLIF